MGRALTIPELCETFGVSKDSMYILCRTKGSPAFKSGSGRTSHWVCFPDDMKTFMQKISEPFKG